MANKISGMLIVVILLLGMLSPNAYAFLRKPAYEIKNICKLFTAYPDWYKAAKKASKKWGISVPAMMAIIHQESHFRARARPHRRAGKRFEPWEIPTTAFGFAQAVDTTWDVYRQETGNRDAKRTNFADAVDFIGWYATQAHERLGISKKNAYQIYLSYYDGISGYYHKLYLHQHWLIMVAHGVQHVAWEYEKQIENCKALKKLKEDKKPKLKPPPISVPAIPEAETPQVIVPPTTPTPTEPTTPKATEPAKPAPIKPKNKSDKTIPTPEDLLEKVLDKLPDKSWWKI